MWHDPVCLLFNFQSAMALLASPKSSPKERTLITFFFFKPLSLGEGFGVRPFKPLSLWRGVGVRRYLNFLSTSHRGSGCSFCSVFAESLFKLSSISLSQ